MLKVLFSALAFSFCIVTNAQIIGPDTVYANTPAQFSTTQESAFYSWSNDTVNVDQTITPASYVTVSSALNVASYTTINYDNGNYYSFVVGYTNNTVYKLSYGTSPLNTPTLTNMGTFGLNSNQSAGIDIAKDSITGHWYAFILGGFQFLRLDFGTSLNNSSPTATMLSYPAYLAWVQQIMLKKDGGEWMLFIANRNTCLARFDFGNSLSNTPTGHNFAVTGGLNRPVSFSLYQQAGNWFMIVSNLNNSTLTRLEFGTDLQNDTPIGVDMGNPGSLMSLPRGISLISGCNQLLGYIQQEGGNVVKLDFQNDITNSSPIATIAGTTGLNYNNSLVPFYYNDSLYWLRTNSNSYLYRTKGIYYPTGTTGGFVNNTYDHTYTLPGIYDLTLHCGQGTPQGPSSFCKEVVVLPDTTLNVSTISRTHGLTLYPNPNNGSFVLNGSFNTTYKTATILITDLVGRTITTESVTIEQNKLNEAIYLPDLPSGSYLIKVSTPDNSQAIRLRRL